MHLLDGSSANRISSSLAEEEASSSSLSPLVEALRAQERASAKAASAVGGSGIDDLEFRVLFGGPLRTDGDREESSMLGGVAAGVVSAAATLGGNSDQSQKPRPGVIRSKTQHTFGGGGGGGGGIGGVGGDDDADVDDTWPISPNWEWGARRKFIEKSLQLLYHGRYLRRLRCFWDSPTRTACLHRMMTLIAPIFHICAP